MELDNVTYEEIKPFFDSLPKEMTYQEFHDFYPRWPVVYQGDEFITGVRIDGELVGVARSIRAYGFLLNMVTQAVVKPGLRGKGIGKQLFQNLIAHAQKKGYSFMCASPHVWNKRVIAIFEELGFRPFLVRGGILNMYRPFNKRGEFLGKFLPSLFLFIEFVIEPPLHFIHTLQGRYSAKSPQPQKRT